MSLDFKINNYNYDNHFDWSFFMLAIKSSKLCFVASWTTGSTEACLGVG